MKKAAISLLAILLCAPLAQGQRPQTSPGVGNAVLLATNSIQIDSNVVIVSGDIVVNNAPAGAVLGEAALSLDRGVSTPAGFKLVATSIDLDQGAIAGGDVYYNTLTNQGTIAGARFTPLALPVFATLPPTVVRPAGTVDVVVPNAGSSTLDEGAYGNVSIGTGATLRLRGGGYAFRSITVGKGGSILYGAATDIVVAGGADFGANVVVQPEPGSGLSALSFRIQVDGSAVHVGQTAKIAGTLYAPAATIVFDQSVDATGAFLARDILVSHNSRLTLSSAFNRAPTADSQTVSTTGSSPLLITLTGSDPEGGPLVFSIVSGPSAGTLSALASVSPTSATVTYTPNAANVADAFTFRVRDQSGATGDAVVSINPSIDSPPPAPTTVIASDSSAQTAQDVAATLVLRGTAPAGVSLTFSIVAGSGPSHGSLGTIAQGSESPERSATVVFTPESGFAGADSFQFRACGVIASTTVCDDGAFSIAVQGPMIDPPRLASDVETSTIANHSVLVSLGDSSLRSANGRFVMKPTAAMLQPAAIAGNVADADADGLGDNANALPGSAPVFMSAGVHLSGGPGSNGTVRMQFEWDLSSIAPTVSSLQSAQVLLPTHRGSVDSADTFFYWGAVSGDGKLSNSDFETQAEPIAGAVMPVPESMPAGGDGTFSFDVLDQLRASVNAGFNFFVVQGRVDERQTAAVRGLEVRTTASGNQTDNAVPMLAVATPGLTPPLLYRITSLPKNGTLHDSAGLLITEVPYELQNSQVTYTPLTNFLGVETFGFDASFGTVTTAAVVRITVFLPDCRSDRRGCDDGR